MDRVRSVGTTALVFFALAAVAQHVSAHVAAVASEQTDGAASSAAYTTASSPPALAHVRFIDRGLTVEPPHEPPRTAFVKMPLFGQYRLRTQSRQRATITFVDGTTLHMNQLTDAELYDAHTTVVHHGEVNQILRPGTTHRIQTSTTIAAAIGTNFDVKVEGARSTIIVVSGAVTVQNPSGTVEVQKDQETVVEKGKPPSPPRPVDAQTAIEWTDGLPAPDVGENIALRAAGGQIIAFSSEATSPSGTGVWDVGHINDGRLDLGWEASKPANQWVKFGFTGARGYSISDVIIDPAATGGDTPDADLKDFEIRVSNTGTGDPDFTTVFRGTCQQKDVLQGFRLPQPVIAKYVELMALTNYGNPNRVAVAEMEIVATPVAFNWPFGVAVDSHQDIYVADTYNARIMKVSPRGLPLAVWGTKGHGRGQFVFPYGIATDRQGDVYVSDSGNHRIQKFRSNGQWLASWGSYGGGAGQFRQPQGLFVDAHDNVYVGDFRNARIQEFSQTGRFLSQWGPHGPADVGFPYYVLPHGVAVDKRGNVYETDQNSGHILKLSPTDRVLQIWSTQTVRPNEPGLGITVDARGYVYVSFPSGSVQKYGLDGRLVVGWGTGNRFGEPEDVTLDSQGNVYVADMFGDRIVKLSSTGHQSAAFGKYGSVPALLGSPTGLSVDSLGQVYIADLLNNRIQKRSRSGRVLAVWGSRGHAPNQFDRPWSTAVDAAGNVYVADSNNQRFEKYSPNGQLQRIFPFQVTYIAVDTQGNLYVTVTAGGQSDQPQIKKISPTGQLLSAWGPEGSGPGQFRVPSEIALDGKGNIYVADKGNDRIQELSPTGQFIAQWHDFPGTSNHPADVIRSPTAVAVDSKGDIYTGNNDDNDGRILKFSRDGQLLATWGGYGPLPGQTQNPESIALNTQGDVLVADASDSNQRVDVFGPTGRLLAVWE